MCLCYVNGVMTLAVSDLLIDVLRLFLMWLIHVIGVLTFVVDLLRLPVTGLW